MKTNKMRRILSCALALVMVLLAVPFGSLRASAATETFTFDPTTLTAAADKEVLTGSFGTNNYFTANNGTAEAKNSVVLRWKSSSGVYAVEVGKVDNSSIDFTVTGSATLSMDFSSTGTSNQSAIGIRDSAGNLVASDTGDTSTVVTGASGGRTTVTYTLAEGTYRICSPDIGNTNTKGRGARIYTITVVQTTGGGTTCTHEDANNDGRCDLCSEIIDGIAAGFSRSLTLEGDIGVNFYMDLTDATIADTGAKMRFTVGGVDTDIPVSEATVIDGHYRFTCHVAAKQMADEITAKIVRGDGTEGKVFTYSVKTYFQNKLAEADVTQEMKDLAAAMLNYGAAAQTYFGYNTTALANDGMGFTPVTMLDASAVQGYTKSLTYQDQNAGIIARYATVALESKTLVRACFQISNGAQISDYTFTVSDGTNTWEAQCVAMRSDMYILEIPNIAAQDLENMYTISVSKAGAPVLEMQYGVFSYVSSKLTDTTAGEPLKLLVSALYAYNQAANAYFAI